MIMVELLHNRSIISLSGTNSLDFLQSIVTNDLTSYSYLYTYLLSPQGRYLYDFFILKLGANHFLIETDFSSTKSLLKKLVSYNLRRNIELKNLSCQYSVLYSRKKLESKEGVISSILDPRFSKLGFRSVVKSSYVKQFNLVNKKLYTQDKYKFTIPDGLDDLIINESMAYYFGAEELSAISFVKGCYVGQEVVSRLKSQGKKRKRLFKLISEKEINFNKGTEIKSLTGNIIGILCSSYGKLGIGLLNYEEYLKLDYNIAFIEGIQKVFVFYPEWSKDH